MRPITKIFAGIAFMSSMATVSYSAAPSYKAIQNTTNNTFTTGDKTFLLNGKPFVVKAAEIHYPRIPRPYWEHRIKMCKALGMNTICIYIFWNNTSSTKACSTLRDRTMWQNSAASPRRTACM